MKVGVVLLHTAAQAVHCTTPGSPIYMDSDVSEAPGVV